MSTPILLRFSAKSALLLLVLMAGGSSASAAGGTAQVQNVSPTGAISPGTQVTFYVSTSGFYDAKFALTDAFSATGATTGAIDKAGYFSWTPGVYDAGMHNLTVVVTDAYSHSATTTANIIVASNTAIVSSLSPGPVVAVHRSLTFTVTAPGFTTPNYSVYDSYPGSTLSPANINSSGAFSWTPTTDDVGIHPVTVRVSDAYGHSAQTIETVTVITPTVSITSLSPGTAAGVGSSVSFLANAPMLTGPAYSVSDAFNGATTIGTSVINSAGIFLWKPAAADLGFHTLTVTAADTYGNAASTTVMVRITPATSAAGAPTSIPAATPAVSTPAAATTPSATATARYRFTTYLGIGSRGTAVTELQKHLTEVGSYTGPVTGYFGLLTAAGVKKFQSAHGISPVGFVGPATRTALNTN